MNLTLTPEVAAVYISLLSLATSAFTYWATVHQHSDSEGADLVKEHYDDMLRLHELRADRPMQSHLFETGDDYQAAAARIRRVVATKDDVELELLMLEERAVARRLFSMYESNLYQWRMATAQKSKFRIKFLKDVIDYFTSRVLTNPRLRWYWMTGGGGLCAHYEAHTLDHHQLHVRGANSDPHGPFARHGPDDLTRGKDAG